MIIHMQKLKKKDCEQTQTEEDDTRTYHEKKKRQRWRRKERNMLKIKENMKQLVNTVGGSCKKKEMLREAQAKRIIENLANDEIGSGRVLNQENGFALAGHTHWGSHYKTLGNLINLFGSMIDMLDAIVEDGLETDQKFVSSISFDFVFILHMMASILGITNDFP